MKASARLGLALAASVTLAAPVFAQGWVQDYQRNFEIGGRQGSRSAGPAQATGDFDFYVLALSWSPSYCERSGDRADPEQCGVHGPRGFVLHGLWPQYERGFPKNCRTTGRQPTRAQVEGVLDLWPGPGLVRHEWRTHGTCSGLDPVSYFALAREAVGKVVTPPSLERVSEDVESSPVEVERAFIAANPRLKPSMIAVQCDGGAMSEVRICMSKDLAFRPCPEVDRSACRASRVSLPAARR
ncbi:ribonuclease T2 [Hansschlegelia quercus]|uniref:Ribonuclease T n=1 Tax=Hansschlegelia quercus TaxID=2528245 RepID=A0A4V2JDF6_9HYPH|nr:ribonuclease T2 [Hansschlegelia quercus]TBN48604.1 ribonuclease T [Hansschlegelia quercus]